MDILEFLMANWVLIVVSAALGWAVGMFIYTFVKKPTAEQIKQVKEWLKWAVIEARRELGEDTGQAKLVWIYNQFVMRFPWASIIKYELFEIWVKEALQNLEEWLAVNPALGAYILRK